ncbi:MAG: peptide ABC transporter substrate-binding protein [Nitrospinae bacterium]|nr:peptide ABC transporter substrate-binding protein [Nitrospinota bacterium]
MKRFLPWVCRGLRPRAPLIFLAGTLALLSACSEGGVSPGKERAFRMAIGSEPPTLDWSLATDGVSFDIVANLMEGLTQYDADLQPVPAVARKWEFSEEGKVITFYLRDDVRWTDGKPVTARDFEYSWKRLLSPATAAQYAYFLFDVENAYEYNSGKVKDWSAVGVKAISPTVLQVRLKRPVVYFPSIATFMVTFPQREDIIARYGDRWTDPGKIVTNGPFVLDEWKHEYKLVLKANKDYYGPQASVALEPNGSTRMAPGKRPEATPPRRKREAELSAAARRPVKIDKAVMYIVREATTSLTLYETGELDMTALPPVAIPSYKNNPEYVHLPLLRGYYYGFNARKPPFDNALVRRAFALAIDRSRIPEILQGGEIPSASWIPKGMFGYNPAIGSRFDPEKARAALAQAGYPGGKGLPPIMAVYNSDPNNRLIAEFIQDQWRKHLNVSVEFESQEWKVFLDRLRVDPPQIFRLGWGADFPDPDNFMNLFTSASGNNRAHWENPEYDELVARAAAEPDPGKRRGLYDEAQVLLTETEVPIVPLFIHAQNRLVKPYVKGMQLNAMEILSLKSVELETPQ